ncbi:hypothetical protein E2C01_040021 [Portunus trituberculatus]|uniref:Uncharacterized protein n=1 Tax=Portunus trituberculatus TaxID=210409 RepID=A0A5B7FLL0_PORTR|nr:hypothetical protein [Portunus trituberculatus]
MLVGEVAWACSWSGALAERLAGGVRQRLQRVVYRAGVTRQLALLVREKNESCRKIFYPSCKHSSLTLRASHPRRHEKHGSR